MVDVSDVVPVKSTVEILQNFVAFSECMNFKYHLINMIVPSFFWFDPFLEAK